MQRRGLYPYISNYRIKVYENQCNTLKITPFLTYIDSITIWVRRNFLRIHFAMVR